MTVHRIAVLAAVGLVGAVSACATRSTAASAASASGAAAQPPAPDPWPRQLQLPDAAVLVYQPQVESWQGNQLQFRCAVAATPNGAQNKIFGVIWGTAQTQVDRVNRRVTLDNLTLTRSNFPTVSDGGAAYLSELQQQLPGVARTISLDRLEASLAASGTFSAPGVAVVNTAPEIIITYSPAILVPIEGKAVMRNVPGTPFQRVINSRALIVRATSGGPYFLHVYDGWLTAGVVDGPWTLVTNPPDGLDALARQLAASGQVDLLDGGGAQPKPSLANGMPTIYVTHHPAEIIVFNGPPNLQPIATTGLLWAANTTSDVIVDTSNNAYYVLLSGRWYTAPSLNGPWSFVAANALPPGFATIPPSSPAGVVLAAVAGTPQAQEATIENSIPQTARVPLQNGPTFSAVYDGAPQWRPIAGTPLKYAANSPTPIIQVDAATYYALRAGVWFTATSPQGPWAVATSVPPIIYTVPPSSPMYYVTYVRVYGATPQVVYEGYTPGYLGTVVTPDGTVVYGTGYVYDPWIGNAWYAAPATYGLAAQPVYSPALGYGYGMALGLTTASMVDSWNQTYYYDTVYHGYPCCGSVNANVYGQWGNSVWHGTDSWYDTSSGTYGENASGTYTNNRTGTTGSYTANRSWNPYTGEGQRGYSNSFDTTGGTTGNVDRSQQYDAQTGQNTYTSSSSAQTKGGSSATRTTSYSSGAQGDSASRSTTVANANTGQTNTYSSGYNGDDRYADANGNTYSNDGSGWQKTTSSGTQSAAPDDTTWADREASARSAAENRFRSFQNGGGAFRGWGAGDGSFANRFSNGGFGDRFGEAAGRFGGGGWRR